MDAVNVERSLDEPSPEEIEGTHADEDGDEYGKEQQQEKGPEKRIGNHLSTAHLQISHADVIIINKADNISTERLEIVERRIRAINGLARVLVTSYSRVPDLERYLLDLKAYNAVDNNLAEIRESRVGGAHSHLDPVSLYLLSPFPQTSRPSHLPKDDICPAPSRNSIVRCSMKPLRKAGVF